MGKVLQFKNQLALIGIKTLGEKEIFEMIENNKSSLQKMQLWRLRKSVKDLISSKDLTEPNDLITELDIKVRQSVKYYR